MDNNPSFLYISEVIEKLAQQFYAKIVEGKLVDRVVDELVEKNFTSVDLDSV